MKHINTKLIKKEKFLKGLISFLKTAFVSIVTIMFIIPFYFMLINAFKPKSEYYKSAIALPVEPVFANFITALRGANFLVWIKNSLILTSISVVLALIITIFSSYAIAKIQFPGKKMFYNSMIPLMVVPPIVMFIPLFLLFARLGLLNNLYSLSLIYVGITLPFSIFMLTSFFRTISDQIIDAATIDGCNHFGVLLKIIFPLSRPAIITLCIVNALYVWNELLLALVFLQNDKLKTLIVGLTVFRGRFSVNVPVIFAGSLVAVMPMFLIYIIGQKYFIKGLVAGALKE